jgi:hypothetical protein
MWQEAPTQRPAIGVQADLQMPLRPLEADGWYLSA